MYAAPFDNDLNQINSGANNNNDNDTPIGRKKAMGANKTQKRYPVDTSKENNMYSEKVNSVLQSIHNLPATSDQLGDFNPLPPPTSAGVENTKLRENTSSSLPYATNTPPELDLGMSSATETSTYNQYGSPQVGSNQYGSHNYQTKQYMPNYSSMYNNNGYNGSYDNNDGSYDTMIEKLNYMINLLEEQKDERTNNVTEEVVLYSFLGIFIIFIVDSFARVGKYTR